MGIEEIISNNSPMFMRMEIEKQKKIIKELETDRDKYKRECKRLRDHYDPAEVDCLAKIAELETENRNLKACSKILIDSGRSLGNINKELLEKLEGLLKSKDGE